MIGHDFADHPSPHPHELPVPADLVRWPDHRHRTPKLETDCHRLPRAPLDILKGCCYNDALTTPR
jgi:hypothetical protein